MALDLVEAFKRRDLLKTLVERNLKVRYKGSFLGFFWSLLDPMIMIGIYYLFVQLMRFKIDLPYLVVGVISWNYFIMCLNDSVGAVSGSANLLKKVYFPRIILPLSMIVANFINYLLSLLVLLFFLIAVQADIQWFQFGYLVFFLFFQALLCLGFALILSSLSVFFKDLTHIIGLILFAGFFMTPIIYPVTMVPEKLLALFLLNPMTDILLGIRSILINRPIPDVWTFWSFLGSSLLILSLGLYIFSKKEPLFADEL